RTIHASRGDVNDRTGLIPARARRLAGDAADGGVESGCELRAVLRGGGARAAGGLADRAQVGVAIAAGEGVDDAAGGELLATEVEAANAGINHLRGEGNVGGEDEVALDGALGDPVVGGVGGARDGDHLGGKAGDVRDAEVTVGDNLERH